VFACQSTKHRRKLILNTGAKRSYADRQLRRSQALKKVRSFPHYPDALIGVIESLIARGAARLKFGGAKVTWSWCFGSRLSPVLLPAELSARKWQTSPSWRRSFRWILGGIHWPLRQFGYRSIRILSGKRLVHDIDFQYRLRGIHWHGRDKKDGIAFMMSADQRWTQRGIRTGGRGRTAPSVLEPLACRKVTPTKLILK
jgi:hypothetical protein